MNGSLSLRRVGRQRLSPGPAEAPRGWAAVPRAAGPNGGVGWIPDRACFTGVARGDLAYRGGALAVHSDPAFAWASGFDSSTLVTTEGL